MSEIDLTPSAVIRMAADGAFNDSAIDGAENAILMRVAELLEGLSTDGIRKLVRIRELAKKIVKVDPMASTVRELRPRLMMDYEAAEAAKELLDLIT